MNDNNYILGANIIKKGVIPKGYYQNPLMEGADPFILADEDKYYLYATNADDGFKVFVSEDMSEWEDKGYCLQKGNVKGDKWFWAPEIIKKDNKYYMVYSSEEHIAIAVADSPLGPFTQKEKKWLSEELGIDGHFFVDDDGTIYLYFVRFDNGNVIYMAKMKDDLSGFDEGGERFLIRAEEEWETRDCSVVEGPFVLKHHEKYYLTYSANHTRSPDYAVGYAVSESPYGPFIKYKGNPILHKTEFVNGVGHHSFTRSHNKDELVCVYHCHYNKRQFQPRLVCVDRAQFVMDNNGDYILKIYGPTIDTQKAFE